MGLRKFFGSRKEDPPPLSYGSRNRYPPAPAEFSYSRNIYPQAEPPLDVSNKVRYMSDKEGDVAKHYNYEELIEHQGYVKQSQLVHFGRSYHPAPPLPPSSAGYWAPSSRGYNQIPVPVSYGRPAPLNYYDHRPGVSLRARFDKLPQSQVQTHAQRFPQYMAAQIPSDTKPMGSVTIYPATHTAESIFNMRERSFAQGCHNIVKKTYPEAEQRSLVLRLVQTSFNRNLQLCTTPDKNGFVSAVRDAYSSHHHLRIRPEDVWTAILTQFSFYVNANAEKMRDTFVAHQGKQELEVMITNLEDFGQVARDMSRAISENVRDPELREWIMPAFSTTTPTDIVVASIIMMGTMKEYFNYICYYQCGFPSVTLLGNKSDYELIARRVEKLCLYGDEPSKFARLLRPVIRRFIASFDSPESEETLDFWRSVYTKFGGHCQAVEPSISGWLAAFCFWDVDGKCLGRSHNGLVLDGVAYPRVGTDSVPIGFVKAPLVVDDGAGRPKTTVMIAGSLGKRSSSSGKPMKDGRIGDDTLQPELGWLMYEEK